jgi:hypothetical protein
MPSTSVRVKPERRVQMAGEPWQPPASLSKEELIKIWEESLALPVFAVTDREDIIRIQTLGLNWDLACHSQEVRL